MTQVVYAKDTTLFYTTHPKAKNGKMVICQTTLYQLILALEANNTIRLFHKPEKPITTGKEFLSQPSAQQVSIRGRDGIPSPGDEDPEPCRE